MHLAVGTRVTFQEQELMALLSSEILSMFVNDTPLGAERAYLVSYLREDAAPAITAVSSSGYKLDCQEIDAKEWTFEVTMAPPREEEE